MIKIGLHTMVIKPVLRKITAIIMVVGLGVSSVCAMDALDDTVLGNVTGQDGILIRAQADQVNIDNLGWIDNKAANRKQLSLEDTVLQRNVSGTGQLDATIQLNLGSQLDASAVNQKPAMSLNIVAESFFIKSPKFLIQSLDTADAITSTGDSMGELVVEAPNQTRFELSTSDGLFNSTSDSKVRMKLLIDKYNIYITKQSTSGKFNQVVLGDITANIDATGRIWIDAAKGLVFKGDANLNVNGNAQRAAGNYGLGLTVYHRGDSGSGGNPTYNTTSAGTRGVISLGFGGGWKDAEFSARGTNPTNAAQRDQLGGVVDGTGTTAVAGDRGLALNVKGNATATTEWQIGEGGSSGHSLRFYDYRGFADVSDASKHGAFDFGNVYLNLIRSSVLALPEATIANANNDLLRSGSTIAKQLVQTSDFKQEGLSTSQDALAIMLRGLDLQMVPQHTRFVSNDGLSITQNTDTWALLTLFSNMNGNIIIAGMPNDQLRLDFALSTQGLDNVTAPTATTTIGLLNTGACGALTFSGATRSNCNQFIGLANIDLLAKAKGVVTIGDSTIRYDFTDFLLALDGELVAGYLPGATQMNGTKRTLAEFGGKKDTIVTVRAKVAADSGFLTFTGGTAAEGRGLVLDGALNLSTTNQSLFQLVDSANNTTVGFEGVTGKLGFDDLSVNIRPDNVEFSGIVRVNPDAGSATNDLRISDLTLYPNGNPANRQVFGELVMPGGQLYARMKLTPRN